MSDDRPAEVAIVAATAILIPLLLAATHVIDVFDGRNVIAIWVPWAVLLAAGLGVARAPKAGALLGLGLCAVSLAVIAATNLTPGYQRDDWRGAAQALPKSGPSDRILISELDSSLPLSIYLPATRALTGSTVWARELDFIALRTRRTGRSPLPPQAPTQAPPGFHFVGMRKTESYVVSTFLAPRAMTVSLRLLRKLSDEPEAEAILQR